MTIAFKELNFIIVRKQSVQLIIIWRVNLAWLFLVSSNYTCSQKVQNVEMMKSQSSPICYKRTLDKGKSILDMSYVTCMEVLDY